MFLASQSEQGFARWLLDTRLTVTSTLRFLAPLNMHVIRKTWVIGYFLLCVHESLLFEVLSIDRYGIGFNGWEADWE